jgi:hypothetical protein
MPFAFSVGLLLFAIVMTYRIRPERPISWSSDPLIRFIKPAVGATSVARRLPDRQAPLKAMFPWTGGG